WCESRRHLQSTVQIPTGVANAQTSRARSLPCPHARPGFVVSVRRRTARLLLDEPGVVPRAHRLRYLRMQFAEARMIVTTYNQHVRLLSSEPFGCLAPPKSTRAWEPTLLCNHYAHCPCCARQSRARCGEMLFPW